MDMGDNADVDVSDDSVDDSDRDSEDGSRGHYAHPQVSDIINSDTTPALDIICFRHHPL